MRAPTDYRTGEHHMGEDGIGYQQTDHQQQPGSDEQRRRQQAATGGAQAFRVPAGAHGDVVVVSGPRLLAGATTWPTLAQHRTVWPRTPVVKGQGLLDVLSHAAIRGRGGAAFPFARKVATALESGRRRAVVVNAAEGEPGSAKDSALLTSAPHLVLDGAEAVARALGVRTIHLVVPGERRLVGDAAAAAISERDGRIDYVMHETTGGFVGGQARAVVELIEGRPNLPVTAWQPEAISGIKGRPTLLSNAETYAQAAAALVLGPAGYAQVGTPQEPGTTLLTVAGDTPRAAVLEVPHGTPLTHALAMAGFGTGPLLVGGYHGAWVTAQEVERRLVLAADLRDAGASLGAGVLLPVAEGACPVTVTSAIVTYLAGQSAGRCGPCRFGLPALARATAMLGRGGVVRAAARIEQLAQTVEGRGACAHPDGTARLVRSLLRTFPGEVAAHAAGFCEVAGGGVAR